MIFSVKSLSRKPFLLLLDLLIIILAAMTAYSFFVGVSSKKKASNEKKYEKTRYEQYLKSIREEKNEISEFFGFLEKYDARLIEFTYLSGRIESTVMLELSEGQEIITKYSVKKISELKTGEKSIVFLSIFTE
ncbi:MAG TPA: hypothetical protein PLP09_01115 [Petrotogaceae bacterium]|mgnify:CR=1 FL=1|nr:hypothetical protein [Petrotogaceae bacterium]